MPCYHVTPPRHGLSLPHSLTDAPLSRSCSSCLSLSLAPGPAVVVSPPCAHHAHPLRHAGGKCRRRPLPHYPPTAECAYVSQSLAQTPPSFPACSRWCCCLPACLRAWVVLQVAHDIHRDEPNFSIVEMVATNIAMVGGGGRGGGMRHRLEECRMRHSQTRRSAMSTSCLTPSSSSSSSCGAGCRERRVADHPRPQPLRTAR